jgi:hypothetical protein
MGPAILWVISIDIPATMTKLAIAANTIPQIKGVGRKLGNLKIFNWKSGIKITANVTAVDPKPTPSATPI